MASVRETAIDALYDALSEISGPTVSRNDVETFVIPSDGLINIVDGDPGEPEITLSPTTYSYEHRVEVECYVQGASGRDSDLDDLLSSVGAKIEEDDTLGGKVELAEAQAPLAETLEIEGASGVKGAIVPVILYYSTTNPI